jgi:XTP/dITP diphosphohydrolase
VKELDGRPGVFSARYAGPQADSEANMAKLLAEMNGIIDRSARFRTVITLILENGDTHQFDGRVNGQIVAEQHGTKGFGYDPLFIPDGFDVTFAQMSSGEKNKISHRGNAVRKLVDFLIHQ